MAGNVFVHAGANARTEPPRMHRSRRLTSPDARALLRCPPGPAAAGWVGAQVHPTAKLGPNVAVGPNARIGAGVRLMNCIILDDVEIRCGCDPSALRLRCHVLLADTDP